MAKATLALSEAMAQTFTTAEKRAITNRARTLSFHLDHGPDSPLHPIAQLLDAAFLFDSYEMKCAALKLWEQADETQKARWTRDTEHALRSILWHERYTPGVREMLTRLVTTNKAYDFSADIGAGISLAFSFTKADAAPPIAHRPRPDYLRVVQAEAGGD